MLGAPALQMLIAQHITHRVVKGVESGKSGISLSAWLLGISFNKLKFVFQAAWYAAGGY